MGALAELGEAPREHLIGQPMQCLVLLGCVRFQTNPGTKSLINFATGTKRRQVQSIPIPWTIDGTRVSASSPSRCVGLIALRAAWLVHQPP